MRTHNRKYTRAHTHARTHTTGRVHAHPHKRTHTHPHTHTHARTHTPECGGILNGIEKCRIVVKSKSLPEPMNGMLLAVGVEAVLDGVS